MIVGQRPPSSRHAHQPAGALKSAELTAGGARVSGVGTEPTSKPASYSLGINLLAV